MKKVRLQRLILSFATALGCLYAQGCYNPKAVQSFLQKPRTPVSTVDYRVYPPDVLLISSDNVKELRPELGQRGLRVPVNPDGKINIPLLGEIIVAGKTLPEIQRALLKATKEYYSEASVEVSVIGFNSQNYYVFGEVQTPGAMRWTGRDSLLDAIARAQPNMETAWPERIIIIRGDAPQDGGFYPETDSGTYVSTGVRPESSDRPRHKMVVNMWAMVKSGDLSNNILLMPNDVVYVQPNPFAKIARDMDTLFLPLRSFRGGVSDVRNVVTDIRAIRDPNDDNSVFVSN